MAILSLPNVLGDIPAEGRLIVTAAEDCDWIVWGLEYRYDHVLDLSPAPQSGPAELKTAQVETRGFRGA